MQHFLQEESKYTYTLESNLLETAPYFLLLKYNFEIRAMKIFEVQV